MIADRAPARKGVVRSERREFRIKLAKLAVLSTVTPCCYRTLVIFGKVAGDRNEAVH